MYLSYAYAHGAWTSWVLVAVAIFVAGFLSTFAKLSNAVADWANNALAVVTFGRLARFAMQLAFNLAGLSVLYYGGVIVPDGIAKVGGVVGAAVLTTLASQGAQYFGIFLFQRRIGDLYGNVLLGLAATIVITALGTAGLPVAREAFLIVGIGFGAVIFGMGVLSDLRALVHPKGGIGIFLGTFNPIHKSHLRLVEEALEKRQLEKVILHPTVVPWLHERALQRGEIRIAGNEDGYTIYEKTDKADVNVDYFPTGDRFLAPETRLHLMKLAVEEAGLSDRVEVAFMPEIYARKGFFGVIEEIKRRHPGKPIHGIHGSDFGGMHVRLIMDECGWIYAMPFLRRDGVSASAIRRGAPGLTAEAVASALRQIREGARQVTVPVGRSSVSRRFSNKGGCLAEIA